MELKSASLKKVMFAWLLRILIIILCFMEVIVYNEEVLLFACFYIFVYTIVEFLGKEIPQLLSSISSSEEAEFTKQLKISFDSGSQNQTPVVKTVFCSSVITESLMLLCLTTKTRNNTLCLLKTKSDISNGYTTIFNNCLSLSKVQKASFLGSLKNVVVETSSMKTKDN